MYLLSIYISSHRAHINSTYFAEWIFISQDLFPVPSQLRYILRATVRKDFMFSAVKSVVWVQNNIFTKGLRLTSSFLCAFYHSQRKWHLQIVVGQGRPVEIPDANLVFQTWCHFLVDNLYVEIQIQTGCKFKCSLGCFKNKEQSASCGRLGKDVNFSSSSLKVLSLHSGFLEVKQLTSQPEK